jgi:hypothetical protein
MKKCYVDPRKKGASYVQEEEGRITGLVTCFVGNAF